MKKISQIIIPIFIFILSIQLSHAVTVKVDCNKGIYELRGVASQFGVNYKWTVWKNNVAIYSNIFGTRNFKKNITIATDGAGDYNLSVDYLKNGKIITEKGFLPLEIPTRLTIKLNVNENNVICGSKDSILSIGFQAAIWETGSINVYATTAFGGLPGTLLQTIPITNPMFALIPNLNNSLFQTSQFILVTINCQNQCIIGNTKTIYYQNNGGCRKGDFADAAENNSITNELKIYPQPVEEILNIDGNINELSKIELYSTQGNLLASQTDFTKPEIDFTSKTSGLYLVKFYFNNGTVTTKKITKK